VWATGRSLHQSCCLPRTASECSALRCPARLLPRTDPRAPLCEQDRVQVHAVRRLAAAEVVDEGGDGQQVQGREQLRGGGGRRARGGRGVREPARASGACAGRAAGASQSIHQTTSQSAQRSQPARRLNSSCQQASGSTTKPASPLSHYATR